MLLIGLSNVIVFISFVFEDSLKLTYSNKKNRLTDFGKFVALLLFISILVNLFSAHNNIIEAENESKSIDTIADNSKETIARLTLKAKNDSIEIGNLNTKIESLTDSISSIKDNQWRIAIEELEEQRKNIELQKQNIYVHFKAEIERNLRTILSDYDKEHLQKAITKKEFTIARLNNNYLEQYSLNSSNSGLIKVLMETVKSIKTSNTMAYELRRLGRPLKDSDLNIFHQRVDYIFKGLSLYYAVTEDLQSYKEFEKIDFSKSHKCYTKSQIKILLSGKLVK